MIRARPGLGEATSLIGQEVRASRTFAKSPTGALRRGVSWT